MIAKGESAHSPRLMPPEAGAAFWRKYPICR